MGRKGSDKEARTSREKVFRLRCQGWSFGAIAEAVDRSESQVQKDCRQFVQEQLRDRPEFDEWVVQQEGTLLEVARASWDVVHDLSRTTRGDPGAAIRAAPAQIGALRLVRDIQRDIAELHGVRLRQAGNGQAGAPDGQGQVVHQPVADPQAVFEALDRWRDKENRRFRESQEKQVPQDGEEAESPAPPGTSALSLLTPCPGLTCRRLERGQARPYRLGTAYTKCHFR